MNDTLKVSMDIKLSQIFRAFLMIGATSFGGGVAAYLRASLVARHRWLTDAAFVNFLAISQTLPGLNATNMAVLVGDHLRGTPGAIAAMVGMCLPGALLMFAVGIIYGHHGDQPAVTAMLHGASAAAVGLIFATGVQLGQKTLKRLGDLVFVALAIIGVNVLHLSVLYVLFGVGALAIWWYRPKTGGKGSSQ
jgi:chromate transporter